jgi:hypothetical protein
VDPSRFERYGVEKYRLSRLRFWWLFPVPPEKYRNSSLGHERFFQNLSQLILLVSDRPYIISGTERSRRQPRVPQWYQREAPEPARNSRESVSQFSEGRQPENLCRDLGLSHLTLHLLVALAYFFLNDLKYSFYV